MLTHINLLIFRVLGFLVRLTAAFQGTRLWRIPCAIDNASDRFLTHDVAKRLGMICWGCMELAPGWWEWERDCADHNCGRCDECLGSPWTWYDDDRVEEHRNLVRLESALHEAMRNDGLTFGEALALTLIVVHDEVPTNNNPGVFAGMSPLDTLRHSA